MRFRYSCPGDYLDQVFEHSSNGYIGEHTLKRLITNYNVEQRGKKKSVLLRFDKEALIKHFDKDGDGVIGLSDFATMTENIHHH